MSKCNITRDAFNTNARPLTVTLPEGKTMELAPRTFSTGSFGFQGNTKVDVIIDGKPVACQVGMTITAIGSKTAS